MHRRTVWLAAALLVLSACGSDDRSAPTQDPGTVVTTTTVPSSADSDEVDAAAPTSPLASQVTELPSALYDPADHVARTATPVGLRIPSLGIDAATVLDVGVEANGEMEIPGARDVGWYRFGSAPGEPGTTVLAAHIAFDGVDGIFRNLADIDPGSEVSVVASDGTERRYVVRSVEEHDKEALPTEVWADAGDERLVLITCGGAFNPSLRSYESNIIAWAEPVD